MPASQVVKESDASKLVYKLTNIQLEYETIRSKTLADKATSVYYSSKAFAYEQFMQEELVTLANAIERRLNIRVNPQYRLLKGILLLFIEPHNAGDQDSEKYINPDITKVNVTYILGGPSTFYPWQTPQCKAAASILLTPQMVYSLRSTERHLAREM